MHELALVPLEQLPPSSEHDDPLDVDDPRPVDERPLALLDPRRGRGLVALGALVNALALVLPVGHDESAPVLRTFELARARPSLWTLGLVSLTALYVLARRRSPRALRGMRVLVPLLALLSPVTLSVALLRTPEPLSLGTAGALVLLGAACMVVGGLRLGGAPDLPQ